VTRFGVGSRVRARTADPDGHTRLPGYVRGHRGEVVDVHGTWPVPDDGLRGVRRPEPVYAVRFAAGELWGAGGHTVTVDLWESYLEAEP
jgi:nitrile hydratase subunit beta